MGYAYIVNNTSPLGYDMLSFWNGTFGWRCVDINETAAKLQVTFNYIGNKLNDVSLYNTSLQLTGDVYVNPQTRAVYCSNGSLLGTTHMWLPANPEEGQDITVWVNNSDRTTLPAQVNGIWFTSVQGKQSGFLINGNATINGVSRNLGVICDLDTGLMVDGNFEWDPIIVGVGINVLLLNGQVNLSDTNIPLGPTYDPTNWTAIIAFTTVPIMAFMVLFRAFYRHIRKKRKRS
jgi:hypothetical protein